MVAFEEKYFWVVESGHQGACGGDRCQRLSCNKFQGGTQTHTAPLAQVHRFLARYKNFKISAYHGTIKSMIPALHCAPPKGSHPIPKQMNFCSSFNFKWWGLFPEQNIMLQIFFHIEVIFDNKKYLQIQYFPHKKNT